MHALKRPILTTPRLIIRPYVLDDAPDLYEAARESVDTVGSWLDWCHAGYVLEESEAFITGAIACWDMNIEFDFGIFRRSDQRLLGGCGLNQLEPSNGQGNVGYWIRTSELGQGYAAEAGRRVTRFGFEKIHLRRIEICMALENLASRAVAEKLGAAPEGVVKDRIAIRGSLYDGYLYALTG
ncbi:MAG: ribosomal-protein-serine acetyltransferase [Kiritimatiellia bacterium]|jgi:ribosomal-protein-serine acetyltransferase